MSSFSSLEIGKRALIAQRLGLDVTSNNIANVNTPGYSRRTAVLSETDPRNVNGNFIGTGAMVDKLRTFREEFFDREIRSTLSRQAGYAIDDTFMQKIETVFAEPSENGLSEVVSKFFNSFEDLSNQPDNLSLRETVLSNAKQMVERFNTTSKQLKDSRNDLNKDISSNIDKVNKLLSEIADYNNKIAVAKTNKNADPQTFIDERENKLEELAKISGITVTQGNAGSVNVFINGINVVTADVATKLKLQENINSTTGERTIVIANTDSKDNVMNYLNIQSGELSVQLKHYNVTLDPQDSSGGFSIAKKLDDFANAIARKVNALTVTGYGLDDMGPTPPGRNFFDPSVGNVTAENIQLSADLGGDARNIPIADAPNEPGNNKIAISIASLTNDGTFLDNMTPTGFYGTFITKIGMMGSEVINGKNTTELVAQQLDNQRESVIGVNLDEEAVNLIKFQKAFEASSRIVNTTNEILSTLVNLGR